MLKLSRSDCHQVAKVLQSYLDGETEATRGENDAVARLRDFADGLGDSKD